ncbi:hypothetical protein B8V81_0162 [Paenibacillus pasadenensis]|uniref:Uncharacterized protein n=1 Tax=Paenibacillus pasadenensis TaxID=217090 RepID=A0A2N5NCP4_9BACL|nr:hypothetical protein B8V81_0162 [Paenibacillus pasadenensis]
MLHPGRFHLDSHLTRSSLRIGKRYDLHYFGTADRTECGCFHCKLLLCRSICMK